MNRKGTWDDEITSNILPCSAASSSELRLLNYVLDDIFICVSAYGGERALASFGFIVWCSAFMLMFMKFNGRYVDCLEPFVYKHHCYFASIE
ncbi:unnamed protein product [Amaranthus hypochondriacus]